MATAKAPGNGSAQAQRQPSRWKRNSLILLLMLVAGVLVFAWSALRRDALASVSYGARIACVCHFVSGQTPGQCKGDLAMAGLGRTGGLVMLSADDPARTITARIPLLAKQTATFRPESGCELEPWKD